MSNFFHRLFNPHCPHCADEDRDKKVCPSCEILKQQLELMTLQNNKLLDRITAKPEPEPVREPPMITPPRNIPWSVRRQMLEAEDREKARLMREAPKPVSTEDLEKEMEIVSTERERESIS